MEVVYDIVRDLGRTSDIAHFAYLFPAGAALLIALRPVLFWIAQIFPTTKTFIEGLPMVNDLKFQVGGLCLVGLSVLVVSGHAIESGKDALRNSACEWVAGAVQAVAIEDASLPSLQGNGSRVRSVVVGSTELEFETFSSIDGYQPTVVGRFALHIGDHVRICRFGERVLRVERFRQVR